MIAPIRKTGSTMPQEDGQQKNTKMTSERFKLKKINQGLKIYP
jgi:hypothetical protein